MFLGPRVGSGSTAMPVVTGDGGDGNCLRPKHVHRPTVGLMTLERPSLLYPCVLGQREKPQQMFPAPARSSLWTPAVPAQLCRNPACPQSLRVVTKGDTEDTPGLHRYLWLPLSRTLQQAAGRRERGAPGSRARDMRGPRSWDVPPTTSPARVAAGMGLDGKFVKKVLNTDLLGYQKENLCIAFEFNFSIKAFSL